MPRDPVYGPRHSICVELPVEMVDELRLLSKKEHVPQRLILERALLSELQRSNPSRETIKLVAKEPPPAKPVEEPKVVIPPVKAVVPKPVSKSAVKPKELTVKVAVVEDTTPIWLRGL